MAYASRLYPRAKPRGFTLQWIKKQSQEYKQLERYQDIMKSQQLWKNFVDQECRNAGAYIGSPMYEFCPMQKYAERLEQLKEYLN